MGSKLVKTLLAFMLMLLCGFQLSASNGMMKEAMKDAYVKRLRILTTARDSLAALYNIYDLSDRADKMKYAWQIYETAGRADDISAQIDILRNLGVFYAENDSVVEQLLAMASKIPNNDARNATKTFILNQKISRKAVDPHDNDLALMLIDSIVNSHDLQGNNVYDKIALLYQIVHYIGVEAEGSLLVETLDNYEELINKLPESDYPLKNQFYTTSAIFHSRINGDQRRSVNYDKKLLEVIGMLQQMYAKQRRKYRNYDTNKYICYRRMLSNFKVLTPEEVEQYHDSVKVLVLNDPDVRNAAEKDCRAEAYYLYAKGMYTEAIPYIQKALDNKLSVYQRLKLCDMLMKAAKAIGDERTYVTAMEELVKNENLIDSLRVVTSRREAMLRNSVANAPLMQSQKVKHRSGRHTSLELTLMVISSVLAVLLIIYMVLLVRFRNKMKM